MESAVPPVFITWTKKYLTHDDLWAHSSGALVDLAAARTRRAMSGRIERTDALPCWPRTPTATSTRTVTTSLAPESLPVDGADSLADIPCRCLQLIGGIVQRECIIRGDKLRDEEEDRPHEVVKLGEEVLDTGKIAPGGVAALIVGRSEQHPPHHIEHVLARDWDQYVAHEIPHSSVFDRRGGCPMVRNRATA